MDVRPTVEFDKTIKLINLLLLVTGISILDGKPKISNKMKVYKCLTSIIVTSLPIGCSYGIFYHRGEFIRLMESVMVGNASIQISSKFFFMLLLSNDLSRMVESFKMFRVKYEEDIIIVNTLTEPKSPHRSIYILYINAIISVCVLGGSPIFQKEKSLPLTCYIPFFSPYESPFYEINYGALIIHLILLIHVLKGFDALFIFAVNEVSLQFDVIGKKLSTIGQIKEKDDDIIRECIEMFKNVTSCFQLINSTFSTCMALHLLTTSIILPIILLTTSAGGKINFIFFGVASIIELWLFCSNGEFLKNKLHEFNYKLYDSEWYNLNLKQQKSLIIMMSYGQCTHSLKAIGLVDLSLTTMLQIFKTTYTYYCIMMESTI